MKTSNLGFYLAGVVLVLIMGYMSLLGANKAERAECISWAKESQEYEQFYLNSWQIQQCQAQFNSTYKGRKLLQRINSQEL